MSKPKYFMGIDLVERPTFCLMKQEGEIITVLECETMRKEREKDFKLKVENLAKYYNAVVFQNGEFTNCQ